MHSTKNGAANNTVYSDLLLPIITVDLPVSMCAVIGQLSKPYSPVRPAKIQS